MQEITDRIIANTAALSKLTLKEEERQNVKQDMENMLKQIEKLIELDVEAVEPLLQVHPLQNVFREDVAVNHDKREQILQNAPSQKDGMFRVPGTLEGRE